MPTSRAQPPLWPATTPTASAHNQDIGIKSVSDQHSIRQGVAPRPWRRTPTGRWQSGWSRPATKRAVRSATRWWRGWCGPRPGREGHRCRRHRRTPCATCHRPAPTVSCPGPEPRPVSPGESHRYPAPSPAAESPPADPDVLDERGGTMDQSTPWWAADSDTTPPGSAIASPSSVRNRIVSRERARTAGSSSPAS